MTRYRTAWKIAAATVLSAALAHSAWAAEFVILDSDVAGIEAGLVSTGDSIITVPEGGTIVLIGPEGETRVVAGPFEGPLKDAATASDDVGLLERLTASRQQEQTTLGAVRAPKFEGGALKE